MSEQEKFLALLREKGDGSVGIAWRRYFDEDGDGALSFTEFCAALVAVSYQGDVLALWRDFGGDSSNALCLEWFYDWCMSEFGGVKEMFAAFDEDGGDSL